MVALEAEKVLTYAVSLRDSLFLKNCTFYLREWGELGEYSVLYVLGYELAKLLHCLFSNFTLFDVI